MLRTAAPPPDPAAMDRLRLQVAAGAPPDELEALPERCRRALRVAERVGAPLTAAVEAAQQAEDDVAAARRAVTVASAQTRVVAAGLLFAPALLVPALGRLIGVDLLAFYGTGLGFVVLAVGAALLLLGAVAVVLLVRRVQRAVSPREVEAGGGPVAALLALGAGVVAWRTLGPPIAPLAALLAHHLASQRRQRADGSPPGTEEAADLVATALSGGVSPAEALRLAADELPQLATRLRRAAFGLELGMPADELAASPGRGREGCSDPLGRLFAALATAQRSGAPVAPTLRHLGRDLRADDLARVLAAAERLPAQLTFPTALCLLPATVLLIGAPIVHAGLAATGT